MRTSAARERLLSKSCMTSTAFSAVIVKKPDLLASRSIAIGQRSSAFAIGGFLIIGAGAGLRRASRCLSRCLSSRLSSRRSLRERTGVFARLPVEN